MQAPRRRLANYPLARVLLVLALPVLALLAGATPVQAERRVALVIGNSAYGAFEALANPRNDAEQIATMLREQLGFEVVSPVLNGTLAEMDRALDRFEKLAANADVALFFYAGHGLELNGANLLVPVDARFDHERDVLRQTIPMEQVLRAMNRARLKVVLLDACRDNPLAQQMTRNDPTRGAGAVGLAAEANLPEGTVIAFAAAPGKTASDGRGPNSPFTAALLQFLPRPGDEIRLVLGDVGEAVNQSTAGAQRPWVNSTMSGRLFLRATPSATAPPQVLAHAAPPPPASAEPAPPTRGPAPLSTPRPRPEPALPPAATITARQGQPVSPHECDRLAQPPRSAMGAIPTFAEGVDLDSTNAPAALEACQQALRAAPQEARFQFQHGLAQFRMHQQLDAVASFRQAAAQGYAPAQTGLGLMYASGLGGLVRDDIEAVRLYRLAADQGYSRALTALGHMLADAHGVPRDQAEAVRLFLLAAAHGYADAQSNLGLMYEQGHGIAAHQPEAIRWYRMAARQGAQAAQVAQRRLGEIW